MSEAIHAPLSPHHLANLGLERPKVFLHSLESTGGQRTIIEIGEVRIGGPELILMAGPCSVESPDQIMEIAAQVKAAGGTILRGGALKPRTDPYSFQGLGEEGLVAMRQAADRQGLLMITEATGPNNVELVAQYTDIIQIGSRNMQNAELLVAAAHTDKPILLKRDWSGTEAELLNAAEYILAAGNPNVALCERGIRTPIGTVLDVNAIARLRLQTHLPIIGDPSHSALDARIVPQLAMAAVAAGADGLIVEVHDHPQLALSDGKQAISITSLGQMSAQLTLLARALGRSFNEKATL